MLRLFLPFSFFLTVADSYCQVADTAVFGTIRTERLTDSLIQNGQVEVFSENGRFKVKADSTGNYYITRFLLNGAKIFSLSATADGFLNKTAVVSSKDSCCNSPIRKDFIMTPSCLNRSSDN